MRISATSQNGLKELDLSSCLKKLENQIKYMKGWFSIMHSTVISKKRKTNKANPMMLQLSAWRVSRLEQREKKPKQSSAISLSCKEFSLRRIKWLKFEEGTTVRKEAT